MYPVALLSGGGNLGLAGFAAVHLQLDILLRQRKTGRNAVHDDTDPGSVGLTEGTYTKQGTEAAT